MVEHEHFNQQRAVQYYADIRNTLIGVSAAWPFSRSASGCSAWKRGCLAWEKGYSAYYNLMLIVNIPSLLIIENEDKILFKNFISHFTLHFTWKS